VWSLDGKWIYFVAGVEPLDEMNMDVWRVAASGGEPERLTRQHAAANFVAPLDDRTVLYVARDEDWSGPWLWALDVERKQSTRVRWGVDQVTSVAASRDGRRLVATVANPSASLWQVPIRDRPAGDTDATPYPLPLPTGRAVGPRLSGASLFYLAARGTGDGLWKVEDGRATEVWRDLDGALSEPPAVSPDGSRLAVMARVSGRRRVTVMSADGTNARSIASTIDVAGAAGQCAVDWSPDGQSIVAGGRDARGPALFVIPVDGGPPRRLVEGNWANPVWSPDGGVIVYSSPSAAGDVSLLAVRPDGAPVALPPLRVRPGGYRFLPDGRGLVYLPGIQALDFWRLDFTTMESRRLTTLGNHGMIRTFDLTPDGRHIVFDRSRENSDILLIDFPATGA
jgi:Tol biopolymer transport system component